MSALRLLAPLAALALVLGPGAGPARAADGETVASFDAQLDVDARGDLHVTETVEYVFAGTTRHGLQRDVPTTRPISQVSASSPTGAPARASVTAGPALTTIRVGDPGRTVTGRQTYVLRYTVVGAVERVEGRPLHDGLTWDVTGAGWDVPLERVSVRVTAPQPASAVRCRPLPCTGTAGATAVFGAQDLGPGTGLTVVVSYPAGTVARPSPAPGPGPLGQITGFVLVLALITGIAVLGQWLVTAARITPTVRRVVPDAARPAVPSLPDGLWPGHVAALDEGRVADTAVTATLADLTVRGYLRIASPQRLCLMVPPGDEPLLPYEQTLLETLFTGRESVTVDELRGSRHLEAVRRQLLEDVTARGWFPQERRWLDARVLGRGLAAGGFAVAWVAQIAGSVVGLLTGVAVAAAGGFLASRPADHPVRLTPLGRAALLRVDVIRDELASLDGADDVVCALLPFAIALGLADDWVARVQDDVDDLPWYEAGALDLGSAVSVFGSAVESASAFDTRVPVRSSRSTWRGHGSRSSGSSFSSSSGWSDSSGSSHHSSGGGSSW